MIVTALNPNTNIELPLERLVNEHREIDDTLLRALWALVASSPANDAPVYEKLKFLGNHFGQAMSFFEAGIKFEESDTFLYIENEEEIYLAYLNLSAAEEEPVEQRQGSHTEEPTITARQEEQTMVTRQDVSSPFVTSSIPVEQPPSARASSVEYLFSQKYRESESYEQKSLSKAGTPEYSLSRPHPEPALGAPVE
jgi:hypothetical protein